MTSMIYTISELCYEQVVAQSISMKIICPEFCESLMLTIAKEYLHFGLNSEWMFYVKNNSQIIDWEFVSETVIDMMDNDGHLYSEYCSWG